MVTFKVDDLKEMKSELKNFTDFLRASCVADDDIFASKLVSCELITNVIRHGGEPAEFVGEIIGGKICITVKAKSLEGINPCVDFPDVFAEGGRGLYIIRYLSGGNIECREGGMKVYLEMH